MIKNKFYEQVLNAEHQCWDKEKLTELLGRARSKKGMFEGDLEEGELEIGQVSAQIKVIRPAAEIVSEIWQEFCATSEQPFFTLP